MRLATYNVENLFSRVRALNLETWSEGKPVLELYSEMNTLLEQEVYSEETKARLLAIMRKLGIDKKNDSRFVILRENRGQLVTYSKLRGTRIVAGGRNDWVGWLELKTEVINDIATRNTAQVVRDVNADVVGVVECEGRAALLQFAQRLVPEVGGAPYDQAMLIDGNDERGIDVGLISGRGYRIGWMRSHADDRAHTGERVFSRDCPEYSIWTPNGGVVWVLVNHFKSKGYGTQESSDRKRWLQAEAVRGIYERLRSEKADLIAVIGDLNDHPASEALAPLLRDSGLKDVSEHASFQSDGRPGTYGRGNRNEKIDYILLSPGLFERMTGGGVWRKGVWGPNKTPSWEVYPEMKTAHHGASDHAALWCDLDV
jgi:endonuclease/exonuclease/phosphatase family metal-dependent hydrolase